MTEINELKARNPYKKYSVFWANWNNCINCHCLKDSATLWGDYKRIKSESDMAWLRLGNSGQASLDNEVNSIRAILLLRGER